MKYFSLFTGIGGFELGINQAYVEIFNRSKNGKSQENTIKNVKKRSGLESTSGKNISTKGRSTGKLPNGSDDQRTPHCVGYSEIDKYAIQIYQKHFPNHKNYGDITKINERELPDFDMLIGGFPCQSFSIAGKRRGFDDTRGTLFFDIARILRKKKPRLFLLENVKGLLSHDDGRTFRTIIATLDELGYDLQWHVLNSKDFGVPQNRERIFIVGHLRGIPRPKVFPITEDDEIGTERNRKEQRGENSPAITVRNASGNNARGLYVRSNKSGLRQIRNVPNDTNRRGGQAHPADLRIRRLTPIECERLQGFEDNWTEGVSDTQRYKTLGNAVTVNVIQAIIEKLCK